MALVFFLGVVGVVIIVLVIIVFLPLTVFVFDILVIDGHIL